MVFKHELRNVTCIAGLVVVTFLSVGCAPAPEPDPAPTPEPTPPPDECAVFVQLLPFKEPDPFELPPYEPGDDSNVRLIVHLPHDNDLPDKNAFENPGNWNINVQRNVAFQAYNSDTDSWDNFTWQRELELHGADDYFEYEDSGIQIQNISLQEDNQTVHVDFVVAEFAKDMWEFLFNLEDNYDTFYAEDLGDFLGSYWSLMCNDEHYGAWIDDMNRYQSYSGNGEHGWGMFTGTAGILQSGFTVFRDVVEWEFSTDLDTLDDPFSLSCKVPCVV